MYGRGPLGAQRFCIECMWRCNRPISYENALLSFGSSINLTSREIGEHWEKNLLGGKQERLGGGGRGGARRWRKDAVNSATVSRLAASK